MNDADRRAAAWAAQAIGRRWRGAVAEGIVTLKGDASARRFWRVSIGSRPRRAPATAICVDLGPDDLPRYALALNLYPRRLAEPPWIDVQRFLASIDVPVPVLYDWSSAARMLLVEDVGDVSLFEAARAAPGDTADLYRDAVKALLRIHVDGTARAGAGCVAFRVAYDERLFAWELTEFARFGLVAVAPGADPQVLGGELEKLAQILGALPQRLAHRDFHGANIFVQRVEDEPRIRIIDFQDALMAPPAQDLAVLLTTRDTGELIGARDEGRILDFYYTGLLRRGVSGVARDEFLQSYRLCVLQHALKCLGRFARLEREGKGGYVAYVPHALGQARRMLAVLRDEFPALDAAIGS